MVAPERPMPRTPPKNDRDVAHWEAVEEAAELLSELDFEGALKTLKEIIQRDPNNPYAYNLLGTTLWELQQLEPARDAFRAAVLVSPDYLGARLGLSHALRKLGDLRGAVQQARAAIARFPDDGEAHHALGLALTQHVLAESDLDSTDQARKQAITSLEYFIESKPEIEAAQEARGLIAALKKRGGDDDEDEDDDVD